MELVLDASVIMKWFLPEKLSSKAIEFRQQHLSGKITLSAPCLLPFEIINALATKSQIEKKVVLQAAKVFYFTKIKEHSLNESLANTTVLMVKKYGLSAYDASYVALAKKLSCKFITADKKLFNKIKSLKFAKLLKE